MSVLQEVLLEEYERSLRIENSILEEQKTLPKGSVQVKHISGRDYHYLVYREGNKIRSTYIHPENLEDTRAMVKKRKDNEMALKELAANKKLVIKSLGKDYIDEHTK